MSAPGQVPLRRDRESHSSKKSFFVGCWNCRGLRGSEPYIQSMIGDNPGVLVLAKHWLWPYELDKLSNISDEWES